MKFAKVLLFVCAISVCLSAALERTAAKEAEEYRAATKALKIGTGYKALYRENPSYNSYKSTTSTTSYSSYSMTINHGNGMSYSSSFQYSSQQNEKLAKDFAHKVILHLAGQPNNKQEAVLDMPLFKTNFFSGIPLIIKSVTNANLIKNFYKTKTGNDNYYLPFVGMSSSCIYKYDSKNFQMSCSMNNKNGQKSLVMIFPDISVAWDKKQVGTFIMNEIQSKYNDRKQFINKVFYDINVATMQVRGAMQDITYIKMNDEQVKKSRTDHLNKLREELKKLKEQQSQLIAKKQEASSTSQNIQTTITTVTEELKRKVSLKESYITLIETLESKITTKEEITRLKEETKRFKEMVIYWLKGAVYHRVINESENSGLVKIIGQDNFVTKVNDYFFPQ